MPIPDAILKEFDALVRILRYSDAALARERIEEILIEYRNHEEVLSYALYLRAWLHWACNEFEPAQRKIRTAIRKIPEKSVYYFPTRLKQAEIENSLGNHTKALYIWLDILQRARPELNPDYFAECYLGIGSFFQILADTDKAATYYQYAFEFAKKTNDREVIIKTAIFLLSILCGTNKHLAALEVLENCWPLLNQGEFDPAHIATLHHCAGQILYTTGQLEQAKEALRQSLALNEKHHFLWGQTQNRMVLAKVLAAQDQHTQGIRLLEGAILIASEFDRGLLQQQICELIRDIHQQQGNFEAALAAQERVHHLAITNKKNISNNLVKISAAKYEKLDNHLNTIKNNLIEITLLGKIKALEEKIGLLLSEQKTDGLTKLPNRQAFTDYYRTIPSYQLDNNLQYLLSIDNLSSINSQTSLEIGDAIILSIQASITYTLDGQSHTLYRYSGQQFLLTNTTIEIKTLIEQLEFCICALEDQYSIAIMASFYEGTIEVNPLNSIGLKIEQTFWQFPDQRRKLQCSTL